MHTIRLLTDSPSDGVSNMARDEALLALVGQGQSVPTLRFYQWDPPTISLGYFQHYSDYEQLPPPAGELDVVRRTTGGGAILHDREWTYSLTLPTAHPLIQDSGPTRLYELVHDAVIDTLGLVNVQAERCGVSDGSSARRGPFFCFERRYCLDVLIGGAKLAGSAQRRTHQALLQHGSIVLANRFDQHRVGAVQDQVDLQSDSLLDPLIDALQQRLSADFEQGTWSENELAAAEQLKAKYAGQEWTRKY